MFLKPFPCVNIRDWKASELVTSPQFDVSLLESLLSVCSRVLVKSPSVPEAQPRCDTLHPDPLPVVLGLDQQHHPPGLAHASRLDWSVMMGVVTWPPGDGIKSYK